MNIEIPGLDVKMGLELCGGEVNIYIRALRLYVSNMSETLEKMRGVSEETLKEYIISVHGVKGLSEYVGAEETRAQAKQIEALAKNGDMAGVLAQNANFIKHSESLVSNIRNWLAQNDASGEGR